jgi:hypothetical protein
LKWYGPKMMAAVKNKVDAMKTTPATITTHAATA